MRKNDILKRAFVNAFGVAAYVIAFAWIVNHAEKWFPEKESWLGPALFLIVFIVSACVTASLVLLKPVLLYLEGHKKDAVHLFAYTIVFLILLAILIGFFIVSA